MDPFDQLPEFKIITSEDEPMLTAFYREASYEACEYNFVTMYMWQHYYGLRYYYSKHFMVIFGTLDNHALFSTQPVCPLEYYEEAFQWILEAFKRANQTVCFRAVTEPIKNYLEERYPSAFQFQPDRNSADYVYDAEALRTLAGRKYHSKKNHFNGFLRGYDGRYAYRRLRSADFPSCLELLEKWASDKEKDGNLVGENLAIRKLFKNYNNLQHLRIGGIFIDGNLEAFSIGDMLNPQMALIHIEKANPEINGLYAAINKLFLSHEFPHVPFVNREEDLGLEGLRKAKLSYKPIKLIEKYEVTINPEPILE